MNTDQIAPTWTTTDVLRIWLGEKVPRNDHEGMQRIADAHNAAIEKAVSEEMDGMDGKLYVVRVAETPTVIRETIDQFGQAGWELVRVATEEDIIHIPPHYYFTSGVRFGP